MAKVGFPSLGSVLGALLLRVPLKHRLQLVSLGAGSL